MTTRVQSTTPSSTNPPLPAASSSCCTEAKLKRLAFYFFATLFFTGAAVLTGAVAMSAISAWHLLSALALLSLATRLLDKGQGVIDPSNPQEMQRVRADAANMDFNHLLRIYSVETILTHQILTPEALRQKCLLAIQANPYSISSRLAEHLLEHQLISIDLFQALVTPTEHIRQLALRRI